MKKFLLFFIIFIVLLSFLNLADAVAIKNPLKYESFKALIEGITKAIAGLVGGIAIIMFIIAGIYLLTSAGDPGRIQTGRDYLKYAVIGTIIALLATVIVAEIQGWFK